MTRKIGLSRVLMILFVEKFEGAHKFRPCSQLVHSHNIGPREGVKSDHEKTPLSFFIPMSKSKRYFF